MPEATAPPSPADRLSADQRREALLDVALAIVRDAGHAKVSMGTVAERAEVTRALVYKHFDNRDELLGALYRREAARLDAALQRIVTDAPEGFEPKLRALIAGILGAVEAHAGFFGPLRSYRSDPDHRRDQRTWDARTVRYFARLAHREFELDEDVARSAVGVQLAGIDSLLAQARARPDEAHLVELEDRFVTLTIGALTALAGAAPR